ncbi:hypothetical protein H6G97_30075 [Nostoc flagelliforme FACHB-838]|uniref:Transposase n=2 Tax=Nostoc flagelliforme TaxID=1306274 RepID=A0ABR8DXG8_9NOSO|nr:hypothetical protein [Nostoc flagelliforme FACHB-838]
MPLVDIATYKIRPALIVLYNHDQPDNTAVENLGSSQTILCEQYSAG